MTRARLSLVVGLLVGAFGGDALPCGGGPYEGPVDVADAHPDLPLTGLAEGRVGVVRRAWGVRRGALVAAYRAFTGAPLDADERAGLLRYAVDAYRHVDPRLLDPAAPAREPEPDGRFQPDESPYAEARSAAGFGPWPGVGANGWSEHGRWTTNCLADAFRGAAAALRARQERYGAGSPALALWVDGQDAVFSNCGEAAGRAPAELPADAPAEQRRDRAYQIAAAHFYAGRYDAAERRFRAVAADAASPWRGLARYLVVRTITRAAQRGRESPDRVTLQRAAAEARTLRDDPEAGEERAMVARYEGWIDALRGGGERAHTLGVALAQPGLGPRFGEALRDYTHLLAASDDPFARQPGDPDRLTTWIAVVEGRLPRAVALGLLRETGATAWAVAALLADGPATDRALDPALARCAAVTRDDPAWATAQYHRLAALAARGALPYAEVTRVRALLTDADGPTARHLFRDLALQAAPDLARALADAHGTPAGWILEDGSVRPYAPSDGPVPHDFTPMGASFLAARLPLTVMARAVASAALPDDLRARLAEATLLRAVLLDDEAIVQAIGATLPRLPAAASARLAPLVRAPDRDRRRFEALALLGLTGATAGVASSIVGAAEGPVADPWALRCATTPAGALPARFLTAAERAQWARERARVAAFGGTEALVAREAAAVAQRLPREPRMAALLAAAVRGTRNHGCGARSAVTAGSRAAFQALHRLFPRSAEARATPYWY